MNIEKLRKLAEEQIAHYADGVVAAYLIEKLDRQPTADDINRAGCSPIGIGLDSWPKIDGRRMHHIVTLDLASTPNLRSQLSGNPRAVAMFISDPNIHDADKPGTEETQLVYLNEECIARGVCVENPRQNPDFRAFVSCTFVCHEVSLPNMLFDPEFGEKYFDKARFERLIELYEFVCEHSLAGGKPLWYHSNYSDGTPYTDLLILQINEELVDMNMGNSGLFFIFQDTAFCQ